MVTSVHRLLKVIAFNANGGWRQHCELRKQLQDLHIHVDVAVFSETHLKPHEGCIIPNYYFYRNDHFQRRKGVTAFAVRKGVPHNHVCLLFFQLKPQGSAYQLVIVKCYLQQSGYAWNDVDIELLSFRHKLLWVGDLNAKHHFGIG
jgi:hypothetical protein